MRAIEVSRTGGPEVLTPTEREPDPVGPGDIRARVLLAGVNYVDIHRRSGAYHTTLPFVPGAEGVGEVVLVGPGVSGVEPGQRIAWQGVHGSYAEELVLPARQLIRVPDWAADEQAAALPLQGLTAHYLATDSYRIQPGDHVVVHAGAGGVGMLLTQLAKAAGAMVLTTTSTAEKAELSRAAGADEVVDYVGFTEAARQWSNGVGVAAVYDSVGRDTFEGSLDVLRARGTLVLFGQSSGAVPPFDLARLGQRGSLTITRPTLRDFVTTPEDLQRRSSDLWELVKTHQLEMRIGQVYDLSHASAAHQAMESRRTTGKLLLRP